MVIPDLKTKQNWLVNFMSRETQKDKISWSNYVYLHFPNFQVLSPTKIHVCYLSKSKFENLPEHDLTATVKKQSQTKTTYIQILLLKKISSTLFGNNLMLHMIWPLQSNVHSQFTFQNTNKHNHKWYSISPKFNALVSQLWTSEINFGP